LNIFYCAPARQSWKAAAKLAIFLLQLLLARIRSIPIVWTVHNFRDHEDLHPRIRRICSRTEDEVRRIIGDAANILFRPGFVDESQVQIYFNASDAAVFCFEDIFTSASVILAMSFGKPCIVPSIGCIPENIGPDGAFLYDPEDRDGLLHAFNHALSRSERFAEMGKANKKRAMLWDWESIARSTLKAYGV
jgi:glycosyltransferase involved in cell wall biosynthesis